MIYKGLALCSNPISLAAELVERTQVGLCRSHNDVGIGTNTIDNSTRVLKSHRDFTLTFR